MSKATQLDVSILLTKSSFSLVFGVPTPPGKSTGRIVNRRCHRGAFCGGSCDSWPAVTMQGFGSV